MTLPPDFNRATGSPIVSSVTNSADGTANVAPGGRINIDGSNFSSLTELNEEVPASDSLGGVCVTIDDLTIPLLRVSPTRIEAQLPWNVTSGGNLKVTTAGGAGNAVQFDAPRAAPAIFFDASGQPAIYHAHDSTLVTASNPIVAGETLTILATGLGAVAPTIETGKPAPAAPLSTVISQPTVKLGDEVAELVFAGLMPGSVGIYQINAKVPQSRVESGLIPLTIRQGQNACSVNVSVIQQ
jgi:uncharacterized protein (TIGR03437 family)